ncbi:hypothetical protein GGC63_001601 [Paenibacillus sp. OAS669]|nr:hypothetical protein [Paenibacillus sp. OAS669]
MVSDPHNRDREQDSDRYFRLFILWLSLLSTLALAIIILLYLLL